jgi:hypothetical protein
VIVGGRPRVRMRANFSPATLKVSRHRQIKS